MERSPGMPRWVRWIPNALSLLRLGIAACFPLIPEDWQAAAVVVGALTDLIDGWLARRLAAASWVGGLIDSVADKLFVFSVLGTYAWAGGIAWWLLPIVLARDLTVAGIAGWAALAREWHSFRHMPARWPGKIATACQASLLVTLALWPAGALPVALAAGSASLIAGADYLLALARAGWRAPGQGAPGAGRSPGPMGGAGGGGGASAAWGR